MPQYAPCYQFARLLVQLPRVEPGHDPNTALGAMNAAPCPKHSPWGNECSTMPQTALRAMNGQAGMRSNQQLCIYGPQIKFSL